MAKNHEDKKMAQSRYPPEQFCTTLNAGMYSSWFDRIVSTAKYFDMYTQRREHELEQIRDVGRCLAYLRGSVWEHRAFRKKAG